MKGDIMFAPLFSVWQIDAWAEGDGGWSWNDKYKLFEFQSRSLNMKREFTRRLRHFLSCHKNPITGIKEYHDLGKGWFYVTDDWYVMELCRKCDHQPWYACIRESPSH